MLFHLPQCKTLGKFGKGKEIPILPRELRSQENQDSFCSRLMDDSGLRQGIMKTFVKFFCREGNSCLEGQTPKLQRQTFIGLEKNQVSWNHEKDLPKFLNKF